MPPIIDDTDFIKKNKSIEFPIIPTKHTEVVHILKVFTKF